MKILNPNPIVNKIFAEFLAKEYTNTEGVTKLLDRDYDSIDDFFVALDRSSLLTIEQKNHLAGSLVMIHQNNKNVLNDISNSPNAKKFGSAINIGIVSKYITDMVNLYLSEKDA